MAGESESENRRRRKKHEIFYVGGQLKATAKIRYAYEYIMPRSPGKSLLHQIVQDDLCQIYQCVRAKNEICAYIRTYLHLGAAIRTPKLHALI